MADDDPRPVGRGDAPPPPAHPLTALEVQLQKHVHTQRQRLPESTASSPPLEQATMARTNAPSAPIPIPLAPPIELHTLIRDRDWPAVIQRCGIAPHEVGSSSHLRNERGYTALHLLMAYNQCVAGRELAPVAAAVLRAADVIEYGAAYRLGRGIGNEGGGVADGANGNAGEINGGGDGADAEEEMRRMGGWWRLLLDQNNRARWSPLHLMCVQGGIRDGKIPLIRALLKMDEGENDSDEEEAAIRRYRHRVLTLLDRQQRNMLHHLVGSLVPSAESFGNVEFLAATSPVLLFRRNEMEQTPLACVLERLQAKPGTRRRHDMDQFGTDATDGLARNHRLLRVLVGRMEDASSGGGGEAAAARNTLQRACQLPRRHCPADGSLFAYLCSELASKLEAKVRVGDRRADVCMALEADADGNRALHLFVSNESYAVGNASKETVADAPVHLEGADLVPAGSDATRYNVDYGTLMDLIRSDCSAVSALNNEGELPLHLAMKSGNRQAVAVLVAEYPDCLLLDDSMDNMQLFVHVMGCVATPCNMIGSTRNDGVDAHDADPVDVHQKCLTTMFGLIRARPAVVALAGRSDAVLESMAEDGGTMQKAKKKWWQKLNPFLR